MDFQSIALPTELLSLSNISFLNLNSVTVLQNTSPAGRFVSLPTEPQTYLNSRDSWNPTGKQNINGGPDGTRTRDLLRDRQAF
jgi:hypothetical protein